jgi:hypothetical protein
MKHSIFCAAVVMTLACTALAARRLKPAATQNLAPLRRQATAHLRSFPPTYA